MNEQIARAALFSAIEGGHTFWSREIYSNSAAYVYEKLLNNGYDNELAKNALNHGADLIAFGKAFIANPDLVARIRSGAQLAKPDYTKLYVGEEQGYTDYPALNTAVE